MICLDTDFASVLAKAGIIGLVKKLFSGKHDVIITPKVYEELKVPKEPCRQVGLANPQIG